MSGRGGRGEELGGIGVIGGDRWGDWVWWWWLERGAVGALIPVRNKENWSAEGREGEEKVRKQFE